MCSVDAENWQKKKKSLVVWSEKLNVGIKHNLHSCNVPSRHKCGIDQTRAFDGTIQPAVRL